jgi:hypothetical protein
MQTGVKKVFYFHGAAHSLGGYTDGDFDVIPSQASVSLPPVGGSSSRHGEGFNHKDIVSCSKTYTHVHGRPEKTNGPWHARMTSVVEGLNILDRITADRVAARIYFEYPEEGDLPKVSFAGTHFENLRYLGKEVRLSLNSSLLPEHHRGGDVYNEKESFTPEIDWQVFGEVAQRQSNRLRDASGVPAWAVDRYSWQSAKSAARNGDFTICSLVDRVETDHPVSTYGHFLDIPDVGRFFLAEVMIQPQAVQIAMIRAELGCRTQGMTSASSGGVGGHTVPP